MKTNIVKIDRVSDIDTSKITLYDMNNRYIDSAGNMYALRFNQATKKVSVVHIIRTLNEEAYAIKNMIVHKKINASSSLKDEADVQSAQPDAEPEVQPQENFNPENVLSEIMNVVETHKDRIRGIIMNIKNSYIFIHGSRDSSLKLEDLLRNLDIDGIQRMERAESYEKELKQYPRSISYYQAKLDKKGVEVIERLSGDNTKIMNFIHYYEMHRTLTHLYNGIQAMMSQLSDYLDRISSEMEATSNSSQFEIKSFQDARTSINNTANEIKEILAKLTALDTYLKNPENF